MLGEHGFRSAEHGISTKRLHVVQRRRVVAQQ